MDEVKRCSACGVEKFIFHFHKDATQPCGYVSKCKLCTKLIRAVRYTKRRQAIMAQHKKYRAEVRADPVRKLEQLFKRKLRRVYNVRLQNETGSNTTNIEGN